MQGSAAEGVIDRGLVQGIEARRTACRRTTFAAISRTRQESSASAGPKTSVARSSQTQSKPRSAQTRVHRFGSARDSPLRILRALGPAKALSKSPSIFLRAGSSKAMHPSMTLSRPRTRHSRSMLCRGDIPHRRPLGMARPYERKHSHISASAGELLCHEIAPGGCGAEHICFTVTFPRKRRRERVYAITNTRPHPGSLHQAVSARRACPVSSRRLLGTRR